MACNSLGMKCDELQCFESFGYSLRMVQTGPQRTVGERTVNERWTIREQKGTIGERFWNKREQLVNGSGTKGNKREQKGTVGNSLEQLNK